MPQITLFGHKCHFLILKSWETKCSVYMLSKLFFIIAKLYASSSVAVNNFTSKKEYSAAAMKHNYGV